MIHLITISLNMSSNPEAIIPRLALSHLTAMQCNLSAMAECVALNPNQRSTFTYLGSCLGLI
jgi:hypothetical protein